LIGKVSAAKDPELPEFRIVSHDLHGPLPEIVVRDTGDRRAILDEISREAAKLNASARHREELAAMYPVCRFLPHAILDDGGVVVGMQVGERRSWPRILPIDSSALLGMNQLLKTIAAISETHNPTLKILVLTTMFNKRLNLDKTIRQQVEDFFGPSLVLESVIHRYCWVKRSLGVDKDATKA